MSASGQPLQGCHCPFLVGWSRWHPRRPPMSTLGPRSVYERRPSRRQAELPNRRRWGSVKMTFDCGASERRWPRAPYLCSSHRDWPHQFGHRCIELSWLIDERLVPGFLKPDKSLRWRNQYLEVGRTGFWGDLMIAASEKEEHGHPQRRHQPDEIQRRYFGRRSHDRAASNSSWTPEMNRRPSPPNPRRCPRWLGIAVHDRWNAQLFYDRRRQSFFTGEIVVKRAFRDVDCGHNIPNADGDVPIVLKQQPG
jgi:hypothetical protein